VYLVLLDTSEEAGLLVGSLEAAVTDLGGGIDKLESDLLKSGTGSLWKKRLTKSDNTLLGTNDTTLNHQPILVDNTVVGEATHWGDSLLGWIVIALSVLLIVTLTNTVDLLVDLGTVVVTVLTGTWDLELDASWMPSTDTGDLTQTTMGLTWETSNTPTSDNTVNTATFSYTDAVDHLVLLEDGVNLNLLLEKTNTEVNLSRDITTVNLDLFNVGLLLTKLNFLDLGVGNHADNVAVLLGTLDFFLHVTVLGVLLSVLGESFLLALVPVLVEAALDFITQVLSKNGSEGAKTTWSLDVTDKTNAHHWWCFQHGNSFDDFFLVELGTRLVNHAYDMGHASFVSHESRKVARLGGIILREGFDLTEVVCGTFLREEPEGTVTWALELTMRHLPSFCCLTRTSLIIVLGISPI